MLGQELEVEQTNRQTAEKEVERHLLTINVTQSALEKETGEKMKERLAKEESQKEATSQEQRADREEAAKRQAQADATSWKQRAQSQEKAKVLTLAATNPRIKAVVTGELKFYFDPLPTYAGSDVFSDVEDIA